MMILVMNHYYNIIIMRFSTFNLSGCEHFMYENCRKFWEEIFCICGSVLRGLSWGSNCWCLVHCKSSYLEAHQHGGIRPPPSEETKTFTIEIDFSQWRFGNGKTETGRFGSIYGKTELKVSCFLTFNLHLLRWTFILLGVPRTVATFFA